MDMPFDIMQREWEMTYFHVGLREPLMAIAREQIEMGHTSWRQLDAKGKSLSGISGKLQKLVLINL